MRRLKRIILIAMAVVMLLSISAFAALRPTDEINAIPTVSITLSGTTATCYGRVVIPGKSIDATLELWQGNTQIASWNKTGSSTVTISETANITHGLTYTLTISGTADGVAFTPQSITRTL